MAKEYKTVSGDVWDAIAKSVYGSESYTDFLMSNNQEYLDYFIFPDGITLTIEKLPEKKRIMPGWRA